jgi:hypothetical protein
MSASAGTGKQIRYQFNWMFGAKNDLAFYFLPLIFALLLYGITQSNLLSAGLLLVMVGNGMGLNQLHLGPSWFFYFDKTNAAHWEGDPKRKQIYYLVPLLILIVSTALGVLAPGINYLITTLWGIQHFIQQNYGILMLYHTKDTGEAMGNRFLASRSLWAASVFFSIFYFNKLVFKTSGNPIFFGLVAVTALITLAYCWMYLADLRKQMAAGAPLNVPALLFWAMGIVYFAPFALANYDAGTAFIIPGVMHWSQYLLLNYLLVKYKYDDGEEKRLITPHPIFLFIALALFFWVASFSLVAWKLADSHVTLLLTGFLFGVSNVHYWQDAFLWRFREEFQRQSILPYLKEAHQKENMGTGIAPA